MKTEKFVKYFMDGCKEEGELNVGLEVEHFIINCESHETIGNIAIGISFWKK